MENSKINTYLLVVAILGILIATLTSRQHREQSKSEVLQSTDSLRISIDKYKTELHELNQKL